MVDVEAAAQETFTWLQSAAYDYAEGTVRMETNKYYPKEIDWDMVEKMADDFYNDPASVRDVIGDHIYDHAGGDDKIMCAIAKELKNYGHDALVKACDRLIKNHS